MQNWVSSFRSSFIRSFIRSLVPSFARVKENDLETAVLAPLNNLIYLITILFPTWYTFEIIGDFGFRLSTDHTFFSL